MQNRMVSGYLLRDVINKLNGIHFTASNELHTLGALYESMLREMRDAAGDSGEQAVPHCKAPSLSPDPSTLRRWAQRRLLSICCWVKAGAIGEHFLRSPTIVAWDLNAVCRILPIEARSP